MADAPFFVLRLAEKPVLLARVRWPDIAQALSETDPIWRSDPGLFDLPYDPSGHALTRKEAAALAGEWGATLPAIGAGAVPGPLLIRRMPAEWSSISPATKRAWSIDLDATPSEDRVVASRWARWRGRKTSASAVGASTTAAGVDVIDLTEAATTGAMAEVEAR